MGSHQVLPIPLTSLLLAPYYVLPAHPVLLGSSSVAQCNPLPHADPPAPCSTKPAGTCRMNEPACAQVTPPQGPEPSPTAISFLRLTLGRTLRAAVKQSTALSYSPLRLKRTPKPHCTSGSMDVGSRRTAARKSSFTSRNRELDKEERASKK